VSTSAPSGNDPTFRVGLRSVGPGTPCFVIAEVGVNHNGSLELARRLVEVAAGVGADAVKFQTFQAEEVLSPEAPLADYQARNLGEDGTQLEMARKLELPFEAFEELKADAERLGLVFLSTPFDIPSLRFLAGIGVGAIKVGSGELTNLPFLKAIGQTHLPVILSTGMGNLDEVGRALTAVRDGGCAEIVLLHCVSAYPAALADVNLRAMHTMADRFGVPIGFSDHTLGNVAALGAVAMGACVIEKHITLDRSLSGPDHLASLIPSEFEEMVRNIRDLELAFGSGEKIAAISEANTASIARRSIVAVKDIPAGSRLERTSVKILRPGTGLPPSLLEEVLGRMARVDIPAGTPLQGDQLVPLVRDQ